MNTGSGITEQDKQDIIAGVWTNVTRTLTSGGGITDADIHSGLETYLNKDSYKADTVTVDLSVTNAKIDAAKSVVDATKLLVTGIDTGMDALDANDVNSIYAKLLEVDADMEQLLTTTQNVPQQVYDIGLGKVV